jgi:hypothetical protein
MEKMFLIDRGQFIWVGVNFSYIFSRENSAKILSLKMLGKFEILRRKSFEKSFPHEVPRKIPQNWIFRGKKSYEKSA